MRPSVQHIVAEHADSTELVEQLRRALADEPFDLANVSARFHALDETLSEHLRREEAEFFPWLAKALPQAENELVLLVSEHAEILTLATRLGLLLKTGDGESAREAAKRLTHLLQAHTAREQTLLGDALLAP